MSEYQYYEFRMVDRSLTTGEMAELRTLSSRAEITATSVTNTRSLPSGHSRPNERRRCESRNAICWREESTPPGTTSTGSSC